MVLQAPGLRICSGHVPDAGLPAHRRNRSKVLAVRVEDPVAHACKGRVATQLKVVP